MLIHIETAAEEACAASQKATKVMADLAEHRLLTSVEYPGLGRVHVGPSAEKRGGRGRPVLAQWVSRHSIPRTLSSAASTAANSAGVM